MTPQNKEAPRADEHARANKQKSGAKYITPIKRSLLGDGQELEAMIVSCAAQIPGNKTNVLLDQIIKGAIQDRRVRDDLETIKNFGRGNGSELAIDVIRERYGNEHDPDRLREYVGELNTLFFKFERETPITQSDIDTFKACRCTDVANGFRFAEHFHGAALHSAQLGWLVWDGRRLARDTKAARELAKRIPEIIRAEIKHLAKDMDLQVREVADLFQEYVEALTKWAKISASTRGIDNILREAASCPGINGDNIKFDADPWLLNCLNGTIDLRTGELCCHEPSDHITKLVPIEYKPEATCPRWDQFLLEIFEGDLDVIEYVRRALAYSLTADTSWQCWFLLHGDGENGKSRFVAALRYILGPDYCCEIDPEELCSQPWARHTTERAALQGIRYLTSEETEEGRQLNETFVKALTGEGKLRARFMRQDSFEFSPVCKLWLSTNNLPVIKDNSHGFWRRVRFIPFLVNFENSPNRDPHLSEKLAGESEGILAQLVKYAQLAYKEGEGPVPASIEAARAEYRGDSDLLGQFLEEHTSDAWPLNELLKRDLYQAYHHATGGKCETMHKFNAKVKARGTKDGHSRAGFVWIGVTLKPQSIDT